MEKGRGGGGGRDLVLGISGREGEGVEGRWYGWKGLRVVMFWGGEGMG